ncbi:hypothetical protein T492DRAFT_933674, partial [Pavlovales sp. CCMP2436]
MLCPNASRLQVGGRLKNYYKKSRSGVRTATEPPGSAPGSAAPNRDSATAHGSRICSPPTARNGSRPRRCSQKRKPLFNRAVPLPSAVAADPPSTQIASRTRPFSRARFEKRRLWTTSRTASRSGLPARSASTNKHKN